MFRRHFLGKDRNRGTDESDSWSIIERKPVKVNNQENILSVAFLNDGRHFVSGDKNGKIRYWRMEDGKEVGMPLDVGSAVFSITVPQTGSQIVAGTADGRVMAWNATSRQKMNTFTASKSKGVHSLDVSLDATKIATVSDDRLATVWSFPDGQHLFGWRDNSFHTIKFSPDGCLIAFAFESGLQISDCQCCFVGSVEIPTRSIAWASDSKRLFTLSDDGNIHCLDVYSQATLSKWPIHSNDSPRCISLSSNDAFIVASANSSFSFWDTSTHQQIGFVIHHSHSVHCMTISPNYDLVVAGSSHIALWDLRTVLSTPYIDDNNRSRTFERTKSHLRETISELRIQLTKTQRAAKQKEHNLNKANRSLRADLDVQTTKSTNLEETVKKLDMQLAHSQQQADSLAKILHAHKQKHRCEKLYANGHLIDAAGSLLHITKSIDDDVRSDTIIMDWLPGITDKCIVALEQKGDKALEAEKYDEALAAYTAALFFDLSSPQSLLTKWARAMLPHVSTEDALDVANEFKLPKIDIYHAICDALETGDRVMEAIGCFRQMQNELALDASGDKNGTQWELDFQRRCKERVEKLAQSAFSSENYNAAVEYCSTILSLDPPHPVGTLIMRSKARALTGSWEGSLEDAKEVIKRRPLFYWGYELRHTALQGAKRHAEAVEAFDVMLSKLEASSDARVRGLRSQYVDARPTIRRIIDGTISHMPRVLIDTTTGCLLNRTQQAKAFEAAPIFMELVSSMTGKIDHAWIGREVKKFFQYVMFSHRWEPGEPLFQKVEHVTVYKLEESLANAKLQSFCSLVRSLGFRWAWSDTCCIDKDNNVVLQESLVAMFAWYRGSTLTIIHLCDVSSPSKEPDGLRNSVWNTRVWTYQEYVAAERVQFYTQDWKPYLGLTLWNHKDSPVVLREMGVPQVSAEQVAVLRPGLDGVREKLYLASMRETTHVEDIAYSLLGILNASILVIYGEGTRAVGRLLEYVLTGSGDASILAWTGTANEHNSCLPLNLTVYKTVIPSHVPRMETADLDRTVAELRASIPDLSLAITLYDELNKLPSTTLTSSRLRLPGILSRVKPGWPDISCDDTIVRRHKDQDFKQLGHDDGTLSSSSMDPPLARPRVCAR